MISDRTTTPVRKHNDMRRKTAERQELHEIEVDMLAGHPLNREFATCGRVWEEFVASVRSRGRVESPLLVRDMGDGTFQILAGHRRHRAALECELATVPCLVCAFNDEEALCFLVNENLQRLELTPVDEGRLMAAMRDELALEDEEIARRVSRSVGWVRTRQLMLDLGEELLEAVRDPHPDRHCGIGTVEEILKIPEEWRDEAVQMVLHPEFEIRPLGPDQARDVLRKLLLEPKREAQAWAAAAAGLAKEWKKRLKGGAAGSEPPAVQVVAWEERAAAWQGAARAEALVPAEETTDDAPADVRWLDLAARHGLAVRIVPGPEPDTSEALVDTRLLRQAEAARGEYGMAMWLRVRPARDKRVADALGVLDGKGEADYDDGDPPEKHIEQTVEHHAWIDMGAVKKVALWAAGSDANPMDAPDYVPKWACDLGIEGMWSQIDGIVNWVMGLRKG